jgi:hypothetical protein
MFDAKFLAEMGVAVLKDSHRDATRTIKRRSFEQGYYKLPRASH